MNFKPSKSLEKAIEINDIQEIRLALSEYLRQEPGNNARVKEAVEYVKKKKINIFEQHDGGKIESNALKWNKEYFIEMLKALMENFSSERFKHLCLVGAYLYPETNGEYEDKVIINSMDPVGGESKSQNKFKGVSLVTLAFGIFIGYKVGKHFSHK